MKGTKDFYNKTAREWADKWYEDESLLPYLEEFFTYLPHNPRILDLCCGAGYESMRMKKLGALVVGLDFSEESIKIARERNRDIEFVVEDMLKDYSYLGKFDGCAVIAGLVHLSTDKLIEAFVHISNVLNDGGFLFIVVRDGIGKSEKASFTTIEGVEYDRNFYCHTIEELKQYTLGKFHFVKELLFENNSAWRYYIFQKVNNKNNA